MLNGVFKIQNFKFEIVNQCKNNTCHVHFLEKDFYLDTLRYFDCNFTLLTFIFAWKVKTRGGAINDNSWAFIQSVDEIKLIIKLLKTLTCETNMKKLNTWNIIHHMIQMCDKRCMFKRWCVYYDNWLSLFCIKTMFVFFVI